MSREVVNPKSTPEDTISRLDTESISDPAFPPITPLVSEASVPPAEPNVAYSSPELADNDDDDNDDENFALDVLLEKRRILRDLASSSGKEGDTWFLIPSEFLSSVLNAAVTSFEELKQEVGPVNCKSIVNENGALYPENDEPVGTYNVSPALFDKLTEWFGLVGQPVPRHLIINPETGNKEVERYPPYFFLHTLSKSNSTRAYQFSNSQNSSIPGIAVSQTKTFADLLETIRAHLFRTPSKSIRFRIWFIDSPSVEELPSNISLSTFLYEIPKKSLVLQSIYNDTLASQGISSSPVFHLLIESLDKTTHKFPVDHYLNNFNYGKLDINSTVSTGGHLGLANLGNTCYMNSALQCLLHVPEINYYFFFNLFEDELNATNPLGNKGDIAVTFGALLHKLFDNSNGSQSYVSPRDFKQTVGRYSSMFQGYQQQDSQEFFSWLLDALHEDLNRIYDKPYCEKPELKDEDVDNPNAIIDLANTCWEQHKKRNDSVIVDLFTGLYQSTLICPDCSKKSITFDPFNDMTMPLPISKRWYHTFTIIDLSPLSGLETRIMKFEVELKKSSNFDELLKFLSDYLNVPVNFLFLFETFRNFFYKDFQESYSRNKFFPVSEIISDSDDVLVYIIPHDPSSNIIVPVLNSVPSTDKSYNIIEPFGIPLFLVLDKTFEVNSFGKIRAKLEDTVKILSKADIEHQYNEIKGESQGKFFSRKDFPLLSSKSNTFEEDIVMVNDETKRNDDNANEALSDMASDTSATSDGYDSDISLANPNIGGSFGFEIKYYHEDSSKPIYGRGLNRFDFNTSTESDSHRVLRIPRGRPQFNNLPSLATQLPELKRNYYHYPEFSSNLDKEIQDMENQVNVTLAQESSNPGLDEEVNLSKTTDGFVLVDSQDNLNSDVDTPTVKPPSTTSDQLQLLDEDAESDDNMGNVGSLFDSVHNSGPPLASYSDSIKNSTQNSPEGDNKINNHPVLVNNNVTLVCEWDPEIYERFFSRVEDQGWEDLKYIPNPELEASKEKLARQRKATISLYDCLKSFSTPEVLSDQDLWYCPRCKEHKQATKTIQLWSTGDILIIHLKRFQSARSFNDKIDVTVDFPIEGLDMTPFVSSKNNNDTIDGDAPFHVKENDLIYDLIAVDNHYGGLGGGHYTASAKNFRDNKWYYFNDGRVTTINDPSECITGAAYLLFYRKRTANGQLVGGGKVEELIKKGRTKYELRLKEMRSKLLAIKSQNDTYNEYEMQKIEAKRREAEALKEATAVIDEEGDEEEPLSGGNIHEEPDPDGEPDQTPIVSATATPPRILSPALVSTKKSRSPVNEDELKLNGSDHSDHFNKRKQRLISRDKHKNKSIHINNPLQSVSSITSPASSCSSEE